MAPDRREDQINRHIGNTDQEGKDPRITKAIEQLSKAARFLKDPRLLSMPSNPEDASAGITWESADQLKFVRT
jgi:hypothetical protein